MDISERLREERKRLALTQEALGEIGGVKLMAQFNYEKGNRMPDAAYLAAIAAAGVDVLYVLTGQRAITSTALAPDEAALVDDYRHAAPEQQRLIRDTGATFARLANDEEFLIRQRAAA